MLEANSMFEMKDKYLTGNEKIDEEHKKLLGIGRNAYDILKDDKLEESIKVKEVIAVIKELRDYAKTHFANEEKYLEEIGNVKLLQIQVRDHNFFINKVNTYQLDVVEDYPMVALLDILEFMSYWITNHIFITDKLMA